MEVNARIEERCTRKKALFLLLRVSRIKLNLHQCEIPVNICLALIRLPDYPRTHVFLFFDGSERSNRGKVYKEKGSVSAFTRKLNKIESSSMRSKVTMHCSCGSFPIKGHGFCCKGDINTSSFRFFDCSQSVSTILCITFSSIHFP